MFHALLTVATLPGIIAVAALAERYVLGPARQACTCESCTDAREVPTSRA